MLNAKNRIAEIEQEFLQLNPEQHYFEEYYATYSGAPTEGLDKLSSQKILALWMEFEQHAEHASRLGLFQKLHYVPIQPMRSNCFSVLQSWLFPICKVSSIP